MISWTLNEALARHRRSIVVDFNTKFTINLHTLSHNGEWFTVEQAITALEATTTLTDLNIDFLHHKPTDQTYREIVEPLCRCISNLRLRNENCPLRRLNLCRVQAHGSRLWLSMFQEFLVAAKKGGIHHLTLKNVHFLPVQSLVEFCHDNNNLKILELQDVFLWDRGTELDLPSNATDNLALDELVIRDVELENPVAAAMFAKFVAELKVSSLKLGCITARDRSLHSREITKRIVSEIKVPPVQQLEINSLSEFPHFKAALEAGWATVTDLSIDVDCRKDDAPKKFEVLSSFFRDSVRLNSLTILDFWSKYENASKIPPPQLLQAMEAIQACPAITRIQVSERGRETFLRRDEVPPEVEQLQAIAARNRELAFFVASPTTYPTDQLPSLMCQFDDCPAGRYMLVCCLPEVLAFKYRASSNRTNDVNELHFLLHSKSIVM